MEQKNYNYGKMMTITELIKDLETIKIRDGDLDLQNKTIIEAIHNVALGKHKFQIFNIPTEYV